MTGGFLLPVARFALRRGHGHDEHRVAWLVDSVEHHEREHVDHRAPVAGIVRPALEVLGPLRDALDRRVDLVKEPISEPVALARLLRGFRLGLNRRGRGPLDSPSHR